jgi:hypothetical protein
MRKPTLEKRVAALERQVERLRNLLPREKDWRRTLGMFDNDPIMEAIDKETLKIRDADRRRARTSRKTSSNRKGPTRIRHKALGDSGEDEGTAENGNKNVRRYVHASTKAPVTAVCNVWRSIDDALDGHTPAQLLEMFPRSKSRVARRIGYAVNLRLAKIRGVRPNVSTDKSKDRNANQTLGDEIVMRHPNDRIVMTGPMPHRSVLARK